MKTKSQRQDEEIFPDEIFLDSSNLPQFDTQQFEGRIERAISKRAVYALAVVISLSMLGFVYRLGDLQIARGQAYRTRSEQNSLRSTPILTERGVIYDRNKTLLAWNDPEKGRQYLAQDGLSSVVGYIGRPNEDEEMELPIVDPRIRVGKAGLEGQYDGLLQGTIGVKIEEMDVAGNVLSENVAEVPKDGEALNLSIDARLVSKLYETIATVARERDFTGGAGVIMDVRTGEVLAMTSYPEVPISIFSGTTTSAGINEYLTDSRKPFLNRAVGGLYTPGSIVKPFMALAALTEKTISPDKKILSTGSLQIPNPYVPGAFTVFKDWKAQGWVNMREALAVSSNVYFYVLGGGFQGQAGLGIARIDKYAEMFGMGEITGIDMPGEAAGTVPSPQWKEDVFGEEWLLGDTYHTSIGQYGFQVTPLQMVRMVAAIANGGMLLTPHLASPGVTSNEEELPIADASFQIVREGMRLGTLEGTGSALNVPYVKFATKTGTAELGDTKARVNSWVEGFFPYDNPRYAFAIVMEKGHVGNTIGAAYVARQFFDWMSLYTPEYFQND
ncbi:MAG TPA: penicillin-binding transpeptidase domain-containing protein [Candidatus Paceibacterota bacterium]